jgi:hypothetical protein
MVYKDSLVFSTVEILGVLKVMVLQYFLHEFCIAYLTSHFTLASLLLKAIRFAGEGLEIRALLSRTT